MEKDYLDIATITPVNVFNKKLAEVILKYNKLYKPFDEPCARLDFKDKLDHMQKECERTHGFVKDMKLELEDLDKYADADRFELIEDQEDVQDRVIEGSRTQVIIGHTLGYRCKKRGHGIGVFVPIGEYNAMKKVKTKKEE